MLFSVIPVSLKLALRSSKPELKCNICTKLRKPRFLSPLSKTRVQYMQLLALSTVYCLSILIVPSPHEPANLASTLRHRTQKKWRGYKYTSVQSTLCPSVQFIHLTLPWIKSKSFWKSRSLSILQLHSACHSQRKRRSKRVSCVKANVDEGLTNKRPTKMKSQGQGSKCWGRKVQQTTGQNYSVV